MGELDSQEQRKVKRGIRKFNRILKILSRLENPKLGIPEEAGMTQEQIDAYALELTSQTDTLYREVRTIINSILK